MKHRGGRRRFSPARGSLLLWGAVCLAAGACRSDSRGRSSSPAGAPLAIGVAQLSPTSSIAGLRQLAPLLVLEGLARTGDDGRMQPLLADSWATDPTGRTVVITLKPHITFQDGSPFDATVAATLLPAIFREFMGPVFNDLVSIKATAPDKIAVEFRRPSPFIMEALEATIRKPGQAMVGTGPFKVQ